MHRAAAGRWRASPPATAALCWGQRSTAFSGGLLGNYCSERSMPLQEVAGEEVCSSATPASLELPWTSREAPSHLAHSCCSERTTGAFSVDNLYPKPHIPSHSRPTLALALGLHIIPNPKPTPTTDYPCSEWILCALIWRDVLHHLHSDAHNKTFCTWT